MGLLSCPIMLMLILEDYLGLKLPEAL